MDVTILTTSLKPIFTVTLVWNTKKLVTCMQATYLCKNMRIFACSPNIYCVLKKVCLNIINKSSMYPNVCACVRGGGVPSGSSWSEPAQKEVLNWIWILLRVIVKPTRKNTSLVFKWYICVRLSNGLKNGLKKPVYGPKCLVFKWSAKSKTLPFEYWTPILYSIQFNLVIQIFGI